ncbi:MAG: hypothetical protein GY694_01365 [Gammaproteobacteria bacterium]|nr:hypothetical protein [Gammaproteobacteria bacterium]
MNKEKEVQFNSPQHDRSQEPTGADESDGDYMDRILGLLQNKYEWITKSGPAGKSETCTGNTFQSREQDSSTKQSKTGSPHKELTSLVNYTPSSDNQNEAEDRQNSILQNIEGQESELTTASTRETTATKYVFLPATLHTHIPVPNRKPNNEFSSVLGVHQEANWQVPANLMKQIQVQRKDFESASIIKDKKPKSLPGNQVPDSTHQITGKKFNSLPKFNRIHKIKPVKLQNLRTIVDQLEMLEYSERHSVFHVRQLKINQLLLNLSHEVARVTQEYNGNTLAFCTTMGHIPKQS